MRTFGKKDLVPLPLALPTVHKLARNRGRNDAPEAGEERDALSGYHRVQDTACAVTMSPRAAWIVLEEFEVDGYSYRVQRRPLEARGAVSLAPREHEAVALACAGLSRKEIARELGLAPSTVGVLLHRAAQKLHAANRPELIQNYRASRLNSIDEL